MRKRSVRLLAAGMVISTVGLLASACGGGSTPGVASLGTTTTTAAATAQNTGVGSTKPQDTLKFAKCMRSHGVKNFPEHGTGQIGPSSGIDPKSPAFQAAQTACQAYLPKPSPAQIRRIEQNALKFSKCMRAHGVRNFPDPQVSSTGGGISIRIGGKTGSLDPNSPTFQSAQNACRKYMHLPKGGPKSAHAVAP